MNYFKQHTSGFSQIITILFLSAVGLSIAITRLPMSALGLKESLGLEYGFSAFRNAESCGEIALLALRDDPDASGTLPDTGGVDCSGAITNTALPGGDHSFTIAATGTHMEYISVIRIGGEFSSGTPPQIIEWDESGNW
jgi:hypothetical protein